MKINQAKTKVMLFNQSRTIDVLPALVINEDTQLETVDEIKLLGVIVRNDMKWHSNTRQIISKCYSRMWMLRNLKKYGANEEQMFETYIHTGKPADRQKSATLLGASLAKQSVSLQCQFLWESTDLHWPSSTGQCSLTAVRANPIFIALGK